ncbi:hypothetical protein ACFL6S_14195 [Candidatus Poribacteria bacterium]
MARQKMRGPFVSLPSEVIELLARHSEACLSAYAVMLNRYFVEQDPDVEGEWVLGRIRASLADIAQKIGKSKSWFHKRVWPTWVDVGVARQEGNVVELPMLYKKGEAYIAPLQTMRELSEVKANQARVERKVEELMSLIGDDGEKRAHRPETDTIRITDRHDQGHKPVHFVPDPGTPEGGDILIEGLKERKILKEEEKETHHTGTITKNPVNDLSDPARSGQKALASREGSVPGSRCWVIGALTELWPARGYVPEKDDPYIGQILKHDAADIIEAFEEAFRLQASKKAVQYGKLVWFLNRLENPGRLRDGHHESRTRSETKRKSKSKRDAKWLEGDKDIGGLKADWLDDK